jgi:hypothetical protein
MREDQRNAIERGDTDARDNILDNSEEWKNVLS